MPRHWHSGDAFKTHMFNAMSVLFPDGERFFIDSVRHYRERVEDPALKQQIRGFIGQEGHHSREHLVYSDRLRALGYDIDRLEGGAKRRIRFAQQKLHPSRQLAATAALEHLTAIMADGLLSNPRWLEGADPTMARLWRWHALEETEHKAVAYDVFMLVNGKARLRRRAMVRAPSSSPSTPPRAWSTCSSATACCGTSRSGATASSGCGARTACSARWWACTWTLQEGLPPLAAQ